jgi:hypothetical protein
MKTVRWIAATLLLTTAVGCGYLHGWYPGVSTSPTPSATNPPFKCGGPGDVFTVTAGTDALTDALPGSVTLTNLAINKTSTRPINPMTNAAGSVTVIDLACGDVNLKCSLQGYTAVKICGAPTVAWQLTVNQIVVSDAPFKSD